MVKPKTTTPSAPRAASGKKRSKPARDQRKPLASSPDSESPGTASAGAVLELRKKELMEQVVDRTGVKKRDAKPVVEAVLALLGEAIEDARPLNLEPMGKLRVNRSQTNQNGRVHICKLRRKTVGSENSAPDENSAAAPLAEPER